MIWRKIHSENQIWHWTTIRRTSQLAIEKHFDRSLILIFMIIYDFHFISMFFFSFSFSPVPTRLQDSDGEKSDQDLVVDIANETVSSKELVKQIPNKTKQEIKTFHDKKWHTKLHNKDAPLKTCKTCSCDGGFWLLFMWWAGLGRGRNVGIMSRI